MLIEALSGVSGEGRARRKGAPAGKPSLTLRDTLRSVVASVDAEDPASVANVRTPILKTILAARFGSEAASDPLYGELLTRLEADLATHPALDEMLRKAVVALQAR
jgi:hypothetical protein